LTWEKEREGLGFRKEREGESERKLGRGKDPPRFRRGDGLTEELYEGQQREKRGKRETRIERHNKFGEPREDAREVASEECGKNVICWEKGEVRN